jgi:mRNA-degrading endonuclease RelE of RelBE toxin-antitoxin system
MPPYHLYLHGRIYEDLAKFPRTERNALISFFRRLGEDPFQPHDYVEIVEGAEVSVKIAGRHAVLYRVDHAVKEI